MALGETHVIALTKRALADAGVDTDTLEAAAAAGGSAAAQRAVERSGAALLVKNLPYSATEAELEVCAHMRWRGSPGNLPLGCGRGGGEGVTVALYHGSCQVFGRIKDTFRVVCQGDMAWLVMEAAYPLHQGRLGASCSRM